MRLNNIEEVEKWVLGFGTHATVVRPNALRERLAVTGRELAARYRANLERAGAESKFDFPQQPRIHTD